MSSREVRTQAELDAAIKDGVEWIDIRSPAGVWLEVSGTASVRAWDSASVRARDSASVSAWDSASVRAWDSASVSAWDSASVSAWDSASVRARDSASVSARDSASVRAWDSASVSARDSASVRAWDSASVSAWDSASVRAWDSASVRARDSASVSAAPLVAVHLHSASAHVTGGVILDHTKVADMDGAAWCEYHGVEVKRGIAKLFKAVNDQWTTNRGVDYSPGSLPKCDDFRNTDECGGGLHVGPSPHHALAYHEEATRFVAVYARVSEIRPVNGGTAKAKIPRAVKPCVEVDINGEPIKREVVA